MHCLQPPGKLETESKPRITRVLKPQHEEGWRGGGERGSILRVFKFSCKALTGQRSVPGRKTMVYENSRTRGNATSLFILSCMMIWGPCSFFSRPDSIALMQINETLEIYPHATAWTCASTQCAGNSF